ncbi:MAG: DNA photolyase [Desulfosarcina sp.]|nr:DNA photolyase [Desulfobacterales bacterium]
MKRIFIDPAVVNKPETIEIVSKIGAQTEAICTSDQVFKHIRRAADPIKAGKETLYLTENKGRFIRGCPGTRHYECCRYMILHVGTYCPMDCAYCILQTFFHPPLLQYFINHEDMFSELDHFFKTTSYRRIGTGEYTDSLIWAQWTSLVERLVTRFGCQSQVALELKTKTDLIGSLQHLDHNRKTILAWSLNSESVIRENEIDTAPLQARLEAARRCQEWGYPLAFHFDPIILTDDAEDGYREVIHRLFDRIDPDNIVWISLGTLRCMPSLKNIIHKRFPHSGIMYGEFISGLDGKMRYFKPLRVKIYRKIVAWIRAMAPDVRLYFCMESEDVWEQVMGFRPEDDGGLSSLLDSRAIRKCNLHDSTTSTTIVHSK